MPDEDAEHIGLTFDVNDCTFEELEELEELLDIPFDDFFSGKRRAKVMRGLAFVEMRRTDPSFTWEDAAKLKIKTTVKTADPTPASD